MFLLYDDWHLMLLHGRCDDLLVGQIKAKVDAINYNCLFETGKWLFP